MLPSMPPAPQVATRNQSNAAYIHGTSVSVSYDKAPFTAQDGHTNPVTPTHI